jgi:hypothetical protein
MIKAMATRAKFARLAPMCRGESHFSQKLAKTRVGKSGESAQHGSASVGESGKSARHGSAKARMIRQVILSTNNIFYVHKTV